MSFPAQESEEEGIREMNSDLDYFWMSITCSRFTPQGQCPCAVSMPQVCWKVGRPLTVIVIAR